MAACASQRTANLKSPEHVEKFLTEMQDSASVVERFGSNFETSIYSRRIRGGSTPGVNYWLRKISYPDLGMHFHFYVYKARTANLAAVYLDSNYTGKLYGFIQPGKSSFDTIIQNYFDTYGYGYPDYVGWRQTHYNDSVQQFGLQIGGCVYYTQTYSNSDMERRGHSYGREEVFFADSAVSSIKLFLIRYPADHIHTDVYEAMKKPEECLHFSLHAGSLIGVPEDILNFKNLQTLDISHNKLRSLPKDIGKLKELVSLNLTSNELKELPTSLGRLKNLKSLMLTRNRITSFPRSLGKLKSLTTLAIGNNRTDTFPTFVLQLKNLKSLSLEDMGIKSFPEELGELDQLTTLRLSRNRMKELPEAIRKMKNLTVLRIEYTGLTKLPDWISELTNLREIYARGCKFSVEEYERIKKMLPKQCRFH